jgi:hypothetical protein
MANSTTVAVRVRHLPAQGHRERLADNVRLWAESMLKDDSCSAREMLAYLARAYAYKQIGDYAVGREATISEQQAGDSIEGADRFVARVARLLDR